jgi:hypothetical protein
MVHGVEVGEIVDVEESHVVGVEHAGQQGEIVAALERDLPPQQ